MGSALSCVIHGSFRRHLKEVVNAKRAFEAHASTRRVRLNDEAQEYIWIPAREALRDLPIEPNARKIVKLYSVHST